MQKPKAWRTNANQRTATRGGDSTRVARGATQRGYHSGQRKGVRNGVGVTPEEAGPHPPRARVLALFAAFSSANPSTGP